MPRGRPAKDKNVEDQEVNERAEILDLAIKQMESQYGEGIIYSEENKESLRNRPCHSTGILSLDYLIGHFGGIPVGRFIEIYGNPSSGKSTLALHVATEVQRKGGIVVYLDLENALDFDFAERVGVNVNSKQFKVVKPQDGEQALEIMKKFILTNQVDLIILDSVAALTTSKEITNEVGKPQMGNHAKLMSEFCRIATSLLSRAENKTLVLMLNQIRATNLSGYGNPNSTTGGKALPFYASVRLETKVSEILRDSNGTAFGQSVNIKSVKNKIGVPFRECDLMLRYGEGFDRISDLIKLGCELAVIEKAGAWYKYGEEKIQGEEKLRQYFLENKEKQEEVKTKVLEMIAGANTTSAVH